MLGAYRLILLKSHFKIDRANADLLRLELNNMNFDSPHFLIISSAVSKLLHVEVPIELAIYSRQQVEIERGCDAECVVIRRNQKLGRLFQIRSQPQCVFRSKQFPNRPQELARFIASKVSDVRTEKQCNGWSVTVRRHTLGQRLKSRKIIRSESGDPKPGI